MLKDKFLPVAQKLKENARQMEKEEAEFYGEMRRLARRDNTSVEGQVQEVSNHIYLFFKFVCYSFIMEWGC